MSRVSRIAAAPAIKPSGEALSFDDICRRLPHRAPFVLVDRVVSIAHGRRITCIKNVSGAEPIFAMHFPQQAIMPAAFLLEAMAQCTLLLFTAEADVRKSDDALHVLAAAKARWLRPVRPGDRLVIDAVVEKKVQDAALVRCLARVDAEVAARAQLTVATIHSKGSAGRYETR